jgi:hypothetical protein
VLDEWEDLRDKVVELDGGLKRKPLSRQAILRKRTAGIPAVRPHFPNSQALRGNPNPSRSLECE